MTGLKVECPLTSPALLPRPMAYDWRSPRLDLSFLHGPILST